MRQFLTNVYKTLEYFGYNVELEPEVEVEAKRTIPLALIVNGVILDIEVVDEFVYLRLHYENKPSKMLFCRTETTRSIPQLYFWLGTIIKEEIG